MIFQETPIKKRKLIEHHANKDKRGSLSRLFCQKTMSRLMDGKIIKQINKSFTKKKGTVRGLHFQHSPFTETKIVSCIKGKVWDVAIDLRRESKTFLNYHAEILTEDNNKSFFIPDGFAHGFQTLTPDCEMLYFHTAEYNKKLENGINADDPIIGVKWPTVITERSERDIKLKMLDNDFKGIEI